MSRSPLIRVAVNVPLSRCFDYLPAAGEPLPAVGNRVQVPFGRQQKVGLVLEHVDTSDVSTDKLKPILALLDPEPLLSPSDLQLIRFTADYYHHPIGEVVGTALPGLLRQGKPLDPIVTWVALTDAGTQADIETIGRRAPKQAELIETLLDAGQQGLDTDTLRELLPNWRRAAKSLFEKGLATEYTARQQTERVTEVRDPTPGPTLNDAQQDAVNQMTAADGFQTFVLDGVTGSGKTEVYLHAMRDVIASGQQVLVLVPEIGLTPQLVSRFQSRLGLEPAVLHSGLTDTTRLAAWREARRGDARLVVGTRSAVFTPLPNLGLIIVDEEHDASLKQQEGLRYSARDLAIVRAQRADVPIILGSATPTLETLHNSSTGNFTHLSLPARAGGAKPPRLRLVDISRGRLDTGLSESLAQAVSEQVANGGQVLLFLNRRGFAPALVCPQCSYIAECHRCDARMTVHAGANELRCHHCGAQRPLPANCESCGAEVRPLGEGTERLEDAVTQRFPGYRVQRIDSDTTAQRGDIERVLDIAAKGDADILVGTQMLSKGHHFPKLTLVGIVNADQGLFGTDFRASERMAQSIIQVAGRAGREQAAGEVIIQTAFPDHPFWAQLMSGGYPQVARDALAEREASRWPPFTRLALLRAAAHQQRDAVRFLEQAARRVPAQDDLRVLGPVNAPLARKAGRYRAQLLIQASSRKVLHRTLSQLRPALETDPASRKVRWSIDVDPIELI